MMKNGPRLWNKREREKCIRLANSKKGCKREEKEGESPPSSLERQGKGRIRYLMSHYNGGIVVRIVSRVEEED